MTQALIKFAVGVFAVWYLPALRAAIVSAPEKRIAAVIAGTIVSLPIAALATLGAMAGFLAVRPTTPVSSWLSVLAGILTGLVTMVVTRTPVTPSPVFEIVSRSWSWLPVLLRVILVAAMTMFIVSRLAKR